MTIWPIKNGAMSEPYGYELLMLLQVRRSEGVVLACAVSCTVGFGDSTARRHSAWWLHCLVVTLEGFARENLCPATTVPIIAGVSSLLNLAEI